MLNTERIVSRLPLYLDADREDSILGALLTAFGNSLYDAERCVAELMRARWFFHADLHDVERMGVLFGIPRLPGEMRKPYRQRFFRTVQELLTGAGTVDSIRNMVEATIGTVPEIEENPAEPAESVSREVSSDDTWFEFNNSVEQDRPQLILKSLGRARDPAVTNLTTGETIVYQGLLRRGSVLRIHPDGRAYLSGIDVSTRMRYYVDDEPKEDTRTPMVNKLESCWKYTDATGAYGYGRLGESVFGVRGKSVMSIRLKWTRYPPATFNVSLPLYSGAGRGAASVGYEKHLRQEVRHLVDHVKSAGVAANINFYDNFAEKNPLRDNGPKISYGISFRESTRQEESPEIRLQCTFYERQPTGDALHSCGAFDITGFDSPNAWG